MKRKSRKMENNDRAMICLLINCGGVGVQAVTLHTDLGDLKLELFCDQTRKTCTNFLALCASGYYNNCKIHRFEHFYM